MSYYTKRLALPVAFIAMLAICSPAMAQCTGYSTNCSPCATSGGCNAQGGGWPGDCCGGCNACGGQLCSALEQFKQDFCLVTERNDAWPLPFNCWDREAYYAIMNQQYAYGLQAAHILTSEYFDSNTNELNRAGESRVAWIMQNSTINDKQIFVYEDQSGPVTDQRIASVNNIVNRWYSHLGQVTIAKSQVAPNRIPASYQQVILDQASGSQPAPVIPIASGTTITSSVN